MRYGVGRAVYLFLRERRGKGEVGERRGQEKRWREGREPATHIAKKKDEEESRDSNQG